MRQIMICAGEASGDLHAGALTAELLKLDNDVHVFGMGGDNLRAAGGEVLFDIKDHSVMGFVEVVRKLPSLFKLRDELSKLMDERRPDCLVVIDYPDFNMRIAKIAKKKGIPVVCFIAPSAWAWRKGRAKKVAKIVDKIASIFPFEYDVYKEAGADVEFVGHPLVDIVKPTMTKAEAEQFFDKKPDRKIVLLMPGSRLQEINRLLPPMLEAAQIIHTQRPDVDFYLPRASTISEELLQSYLAKIDVLVHVIDKGNYDIMSISDVAIATSGTVTLEAAMLDLPNVIIYKGAPVAVFIARRLVKLSHIGLPNIVADRGILPELIQEDVTAENIAKEVFALLDEQNREKVMADLAYMKDRLGEAGTLRRVAELVLSVAKEGSLGEGR